LFAALCLPPSTVFALIEPLPRGGETIFTVYIVNATGIDLPSVEFESDPVVSPDGVVYVGTENGVLLAIKQGLLRWTFKTANALDGTPLLGADGNVYFSGYDGMVHALAPDGRQLWFYQMGGQSASSAALNADGTLYIGGRSGLYALLSSSKGLAPSGWPRYGKNNQNTHRK
jgi:outer membrane protein assembly factor BamB